MTDKKVLFDECIGKPHVESLIEFLAIDGGERPEIRHVLDFQGQGVWDEDWIPRVANEGWMIVTQDRGRKGRSKGEPLPNLCHKLGITHVVLSRRIAQRKSADKVLTILSVWRELLGLFDEPVGSRFALEPHSSKNPDATLGKLINRTPDPRPIPPGRLFDTDNL